jgi:DMSO/TMAO reductase YedYZ molybdopterin-dependent catalytic subunit
MIKGIPGRKDLEDKSKKEGRLPPGQSLTLKFPVLHYGPVPAFDPTTWDFSIWGEVEESRRWSWDEFSRLPRTKLTMDIHCVTRWSKLDTTWEGVSLGELVNLGIINIKPGARYVLQYAEYGFTVNLPLEVVLAENFLLATHFHGSPLTPDHGAP